jgi:hypothetical protein
MINKMISNHLDEAEERAQEMFPTTLKNIERMDVEFTLYLGSSLVKGKTFDLFYLKNFHLWQLMTMVEIIERWRY